MDFLDSLDLHTTDKKANRVRSWYLYEQYKSLEKNQLDATQKLKNKTYQERILHRELNERRARRKLSEEFYNHQNDCGIETSIKSDTTRTPYNDTADSFFETVCEQEAVLHAKERDDTISEHSEASKFDDNFSSFNNKIDDNSFSESITSVINNETNKNVADDIKEELEIVKQNITDIINLQLEAEKECLEKYTELYDYDEEDGNERLKSCQKGDIKLQTAVDKYAPNNENGILAVWSKLVMFSCKLIQNNRGNCYSDLTSQFLTAVLAFDVLRRGINSICHLLQPYVSPIKLADDDSTQHCNINEILMQDQTNTTKTTENLTKYNLHGLMKPQIKPRFFERKYRSEEKWQCTCKYTFQNRMNDIQNRGESEPCRSFARRCSDKETTDKFLATYPKDVCSHNFKCPHMKKALKPIVKLSQYIDMMLHEIEN